MKIKLIQFAAAMLLMLVTGLFWGTWFALSRSIQNLSAAEFHSSWNGHHKQCGQPNEDNYASMYTPYDLNAMAIFEKAIQGFLSQRRSGSSHSICFAYYFVG